MPALRKEVSFMKNEINRLNAETLKINNIRLEYDREMKRIYDEIKRLNTLNSTLSQKKENLLNDIGHYKKHSLLGQEKLDLQIHNTRELLSSLNYMAKKSQKENA